MDIRLILTALGSAGVLCVLAFSATGQTPPAPSAAAGKDVFEQYCIACHDTGPSSDAGPSLKGIVGRKVASAKYPAYSAALKAASRKGDRWTDARLDQYLFNPSAVYPGTSMAVRIQSPKNRANLMVYLKTVK